MNSEIASSQFIRKQTQNMQNMISKTNKNYYDHQRIHSGLSTREEETKGTFLKITKSGNSYGANQQSTTCISLKKRGSIPDSTKLSNSLTGVANSQTKINVAQTSTNLYSKRPLLKSGYPTSAKALHKSNSMMKTLNLSRKDSKENLKIGFSSTLKSS
jgi:hypothetical protein